ncbi:MAG: hypothetical protein IPN77_33730 [Sandaracinaceae bacterium]|nr:hypothetical protein [Sandaracinaceae bacterium]
MQVTVTLLEAVPKAQPGGRRDHAAAHGHARAGELGPAGPIVRAGHRVDWLRALVVHRRLLFDLPYSARGPELFGLGLHRGVLFQTLFDAARAEIPDVRTGVSIARLGEPGQAEQHRGRAALSISSWSQTARSEIRTADFPARAHGLPPGALVVRGRKTARGSTRARLLQCVKGARDGGHAAHGLAPGETRRW